MTFRFSAVQCCYQSMRGTTNQHRGKCPVCLQSCPLQKDAKKEGDMLLKMLG